MVVTMLLDSEEQPNLDGVQPPSRPQALRKENFSEMGFTAYQYRNMAVEMFIDLEVQPNLDVV